MAEQGRFWIGFPAEESIDVGPQARYGRIIIGGFQEGFLASTAFWSERRYEDQWKEGLIRIIDGRETSCLLTSVAAPSEAAGVIWWILYREGERVFVQNGLLAFDEMDVMFDQDSPYEHVPPREQINEDGHRVSEWEIPLSAIRDFVGEQREGH